MLKAHHRAVCGKEAPKQDELPCVPRTAAKYRWNCQKALQERHPAGARGVVEGLRRADIRDIINTSRLAIGAGCGERHQPYVELRRFPSGF